MKVTLPTPQGSLATLHTVLEGPPTDRRDRFFDDTYECYLYDMYDIDEELDLLCDEEYDTDYDDLNELPVFEELSDAEMYSDEEECALYEYLGPDAKVRKEWLPAPHFDPLQDLLHSYKDEIKVQVGLIEATRNAFAIPGDISHAARMIATSSESMGKCMNEIAETSGRLNDFITGIKDLPKNVGKGVIKKTNRVIIEFQKIAEKLLKFQFPGALGQALSSTAALLKYCCEVGYEYHREILFVCVGIGAVCILREGATFLSWRIEKFFDTISVVLNSITDFGGSMLSTCYTKFKSVCSNHPLEFSTPSDIKMQATVASWKNLRALVGFITALSLGKKELSTQNVLDSMASASRVLPVVDSLANLASIFIEKLPLSISDFLKRSFGMCDDSAFSKEFRADLISAQKLLYRYDTEGVASMADHSYCQEIVNLYANMSGDQHKELCSLNSGSASRYMVVDIIRRLGLIAPEARNCAFDNGKEFEKLGIHLSGLPGVGKSIVMNALCNVLGSHFPEGRRVYHSTISDQYESGYANHYAFVVDDANMASGEEAKAANYQTIGLINTVPCRLNMADLGNKGKIFTSRVVGHTSNYGLEEPLEGLKSESYPAYWRRFNHMAFVCKLDPEFANRNGNLDLNKLFASESASGFPHITFDRYKVERGKKIPLEQGLTYHDVLLLAKGYLYKFANYADRFEDLRKKQVVEAKVLFKTFNAVVAPNVLVDLPPGVAIPEDDHSDNDSCHSAFSEDEEKFGIKVQARSLDQILEEENPVVEKPEPEVLDERRDKSGMKLRKLLFNFGEGKNAELYARVHEDCKADGTLSPHGIKLLKVSIHDETMTDLKVTEIWRDEVLLDWHTISTLVEERRETLTTEEVLMLLSRGLLSYTTILRWAQIGALSNKEGGKAYVFSMSILEDIMRFSDLDEDVVGELLDHVGVIWHYRTSGCLEYFMPAYGWWQKDMLALADVRAHAPDLFLPEPEVPMLPLYDRFIIWADFKQAYLMRFIKEHFPACSATVLRVLKVLGLVGIFVGAAAAVLGITNAINKPKPDLVPVDNTMDEDQSPEPTLELQSNTRSAKFNRKLQHRRLNRVGRIKVRMNNSLHAGLLPSDSEEGLSSDAPRSDSEESGYEFDDQGPRSGLYANIKQAVVYLERDGCCLSGFIAKGSLLATTSHFFRDWKDGTFSLPDEGSIFHVTVRGRRVEIPFRKANLDMWESDDGLQLETCIYDLGSFISPSKNITKYFVNSKEMAGFTAEDLFIVQLVNGSPKLTSLGRCILRRERQTFVSSLGSHGDIHNGFVPTAWVYPKGLADGTCGSLIIRKSEGVNKIVGMHFGSSHSGASGFAVPMDRIEIDRIVEDRTTVVNSGPLPYSIVEDCKPTPACPDVTSIGRLTYRTNAPPSKTRFTPSVFMTKIPEKLCDPDNMPAPAILSDNDPRIGDLTMDDIVDVELAKLHCTPVLDDLIYQRVVAGQVDMLLSLKTTTSRVLSIDEAVNSGPELPNVKPIPRSTSSGYPMAELKPKNISAGKGHIFGEREGGGFDIIHKPFADYLDVCIERAEKGLDLKSVSSVIPKDEIRPYSKLKDKKTRVIHAGPLHLLVLYRKYFGDFINTLRRKFPIGSSAIGMNVYSADWDAMIKRMLRVGNKFGDSDYSGYEGYVGTQAYESFQKQADAFYADLPEPIRTRSALARKTIVADIQHGLFRWKRNVFQRHTSMSTGSGLTADLNTLANEAFFMFSFIRAMERAPDMARFANPFGFYNHTALAILGDDNIISISDRVAPFYDMKIHQGIMAEYGIVVTAANKKDSIERGHKTFKEIEFLKGTVCLSDEIPGIKYMHYADEESIKKSLLYVNGNLDVLEASFVNANMALMRLFTSGPVRFLSWRDMLQTTLKECGCTQSLIGYDDCKSMFASGCLDPFDYLNDGEAVECNIEMHPTTFFL